MDTYSRYLLVRPHQDDLRHEADLVRLVRSDRPAAPPGAARVLATAVVGRLAVVVHRVAFAVDGRLTHVAHVGLELGAAAMGRIKRAGHHGRRSREAAGRAIVTDPTPKAHSQARP